MYHPYVLTCLTEFAEDSCVADGGNPWLRSLPIAFLKNQQQVLNLLMQRRKDSLSVVAGETCKSREMFHKHVALSSNKRSASALLNSRRSVCS